MMRRITTLLLALIVIMGAYLLAVRSNHGVSVMVDRKVPSDLIFSGKPGSAGVIMPGEYININSDDASALELLPGIGETLAQRIIQYREEHGPFTKSEDVMNVPGISSTIYNSISEFIRTED